MIAPARITKSFTVVRWFSPGRPVLLRKCVPLMPKRLASAFIISAKPSSLPPMASASVMAASLPDCTIRPLIKSLTLAGLRGSKNMREPSAFQPFSDTVSIWSGLSVPLSSALKVR